jgi:hypothetical protein
MLETVGRKMSGEGVGVSMPQLTAGNDALRRGLDVGEWELERGPASSSRWRDGGALALARQPLAPYAQAVVWVGAEHSGQTLTLEITPECDNKQPQA